MSTAEPISTNVNQYRHTDGHQRVSHDPDPAIDKDYEHFYVQIGSNRLTLKDKTAAKAHKVFLDFKEAVVNKVNTDFTSVGINVDNTTVSIEFSTGLITIRNKETGNIIKSIHITHLAKTADPEGVDSKVIKEARRLETCLVRLELIKSTLPKDATSGEIEKYQDVLGDWRGENGFQVVYKGMEKLGNALFSQTVDSVINKLFPTCQDTQDIKDAHERIIEYHKSKIKILKEKRKALELSTHSLSPKEKAKVNKDIEALSAKIEEIDLKDADKITILLTLIVNTMLSENTSTDKLDEMKEKLEEYFRDDLKIGEIEKDKKTNIAKPLELTKPFKDYASLIVAAAAFSKRSKVDDGEGLEYNRVDKKGYQDYLISKGINEQYHLGHVGALLRNNGDDDDDNNEGVIRNLKNIFLPQGISPEIKIHLEASLGIAGVESGVDF